ncbi:hypothetical protein BKA66DRAFT_511429 [Pyrenochaeta sp. MPI-SDFR-AT-0127]|nr:hypothetical protein BKA66DRAFT_511429 [Pyrenochaeta sp. MPI-SDFR-AT-0127]
MCFCVLVAALLSTLVLAKPIETLERRAVICLTTGSTATAVWTDSTGRTCRWSGVVGSNFGVNGVNGGDYSCNGRCGAGCKGTAIGNVYTQDCFSHDICSWFNNASGGASDENCGSAYAAAVEDTLLGAATGCGRTNPVIAANAPVTNPICS